MLTKVLRIIMKGFVCSPIVVQLSEYNSYILPFLSFFSYFQSTLTLSTSYIHIFNSY